MRNGVSKSTEVKRLNQSIPVAEHLIKSTSPHLRAESLQGSFGEASTVYLDLCFFHALLRKIQQARVALGRILIGTIAEEPLVQLVISLNFLDDTLTLSIQRSLAGELGLNDLMGHPQ